MLDAETGELKKIIKRKKHSGVVNVLKKFFEATIITKHILDLKANLTVDKLLASAPAVKKQITKAIIEDEVI